MEGNCSQYRDLTGLTAISCTGMSPGPRGGDAPSHTHTPHRRGGRERDKEGKQERAHKGGTQEVETSRVTSLFLSVWVTTWTLVSTERARMTWEKRKMDGRGWRRQGCRSVKRVKWTRRKEESSNASHSLLSQMSRLALYSNVLFIQLLVFSSSEAICPSVSSIPSSSSPLFSFTASSWVLFWLKFQSQYTPGGEMTFEQGFLRAKYLIPQ